MSGVTGFATGIIGLTLLEVALKNADHTAAIIEVPANMLAHWLNPTTPLIPQLDPATHKSSIPTG